MTDLPEAQSFTVATLWIGRELGAIEQLCLLSFAKAGYRTIVYTYDPVEGIPDGVETGDASEIWELDRDLLRQTGAAYIADIWRLHLMQKTDYVWVDTDAFLWREIKLFDGYLLGYYHGRHQVATGVMRTPRDSAAVQQVLDWFDDPDFTPSWVRPVVQRKLAAMPKRERLIEQFKIRRSVMGPFALTPALEQTGEDKYVQSEEVLYPIPLEFGDLYFNPHGGWQGWLTEDTMMLHFFTSALRGGQRRLNDLYRGSLIHQALEALEAEHLVEEFSREGQRAARISARAKAS